ncbi:hypothetical protein [Trinickia sp. EG282A]|uniref:hypothetical protein n=1 Tax=Trinickia sp. EG282A TaxID=3237013 RepID=UPI0034D1A23D
MTDIAKALTNKTFINIDNLISPTIINAYLKNQNYLDQRPCASAQRPSPAPIG